MAQAVQLTILLLITTSICSTQQKELIPRQGRSCDCGAPNRRTRIVGGKPTQVGEYPWMVAIFKRSGGRFPFCGASLISKRWLLSAAHCFTKYEAYQVVADLGDYDLSTANDGANKFLGIKKIIAHPRYSNITQSNDIALLELSHKITYTNNIRPICIPPPHFDCFGQWVVVTGWGALKFNGSDSDVLRDVNLPVISNTACKAKYAGGAAVIDNSVICTMYRGRIPQDACQGDSGGPAAMMCKGRYLLAGIVSYSVECAFYPGVYTNVSFYHSWIVKNTGNAICSYDCSPPPPPRQAG